MDRRVAKMSELISSIRLIKMSAWEKPFLERILSMKGEEMKEMKKSGLLGSIMLVLSPSTSIIAPFFLFLTMTLAGVELDTTQAFTVISIFNALQFTISTLPLAIRNISESNICLGRFQKFLGLLPDLRAGDDDESLCLELEEHIQPSGGAADCGPGVLLSNSSYSWAVEQEETPTLRDINLEVPRGQLLGIAGGVGAGKSSLMSAILGEVRETD